MEARAPYSPAASRKEREHREPDDDELDDAQAIRFARRELDPYPPNMLTPALV